MAAGSDQHSAASLALWDRSNGWLNHADLNSTAIPWGGAGSYMISMACCHDEVIIQNGNIFMTYWMKGLACHASRDWIWVWMRHPARIATPVAYIDFLHIDMGYNEWVPTCINGAIARPRQNGSHFSDDISKCISSISLKFVPWGSIINIPTLSEPMMLNLLTHICVTRPRWVIQ